MLSLVVVALLTGAPSHRVVKQPNLNQPIGEVAPLFSFASSVNYAGYAAKTGIGADGCKATITATKGEAVTFTRATTRFCPADSDETSGTMCASGEACIEQGGVSVFNFDSTNSCLRSEELENAVYSDTGTPTVTADTYAAPYAAGTPMERLADNDGAAFEGRCQTISTTSQTKHTASAWWRCDTGACEGSVTITGTGNSAGDTTCGHTGLDTTPRRKSCTTAAAYGAGLTAISVCFRSGDGAGDQYTVGIGGAQYEVNALLPGPYVKTTSAAVARNKEVVSVAVTYGASVETEGSAACTVVPKFTAASGINGWILGHLGNSRLIYFQGTNYLSYDGTANPSAANGFVAHTQTRVYNRWTAGASASSLNGATSWTMSADGFEDVNSSALRLGEQSSVITGTAGVILKDCCVDTSTTRCSGTVN